MKKTLTRRDFMKNSTYAMFGAAAGISASLPGEKKSKVILIRRPDVLDENYTINQTVIQQMLDDAVMALLGKDDPVEAFKSILKPDDIVGIKSNEWNYLPTPAELEKAIKKRVMAAGVNESNIGIDDRGVKENPVFLKSTALINVRPMRTHYLAGMSGCMKNLITFSKVWHEIHPNNCAHLGKLLQLPMVKGKIRIHILSLLTPQFHGRGPHHFNRRYVWHYKGLLASTDPVAIDAVALHILMAIRREKMGPKHRLSPIPHYIRIADEVHGMGTSDLNKIELIRLGWNEGALI